MDKIKHNIRLDLADGGSQDAIYVRQADTNAHVINIQLRTNGKVYRLADDVVANIRGMREDGTIIYNACTVEDNMLRTELTTEMLAIAGRTECVLELIGTEPAVLTTPGFDIIVERVDGTEAIEGTNEFTALVQQTADAKASMMQMERLHEEVQGKLDRGEFSGADGVSPAVSTMQITGGHRVRIEDADGTKTFDVMDGGKGDPGVGIDSAVLNADCTLTLFFTDGSSYTTPSIRGQKGEPGIGLPGAPGNDGVSPEVSVTQITGGQRITIKDAYGVKSFDLLNGSNGDPGKDGVTPAFSIGTVTTLAAGSNATASIGGTAEKPVLNLGIPKGEDGKNAEGGGTAELPFELVEGLAEIVHEAKVVNMQRVYQTLNLEVGADYLVVLNGKKYRLTCVQHAQPTLAYYPVENQPPEFSIIDGKSDWDFLWTQSGTATVSISKFVEQVQADNIALLPVEKVEGLSSLVSTDLQEVIPQTTVIDGRPYDGYIPLVTGEKYTFDYNGKKYVCVCQEALDSDGRVDYRWLGERNYSLETPFYLQMLEENEYSPAYWRVYAHDTTEPEITFALYKNNIKLPWNSILDRPFYSEVEETVVLPEVTLEYGGEYDMYSVREPLAQDLAVGEKYAVVWNGTRYVTEAVFLDGIMIGNTGAILGTGDTGEPFVGAQTPADSVENLGYFGFAAIDGSTDPITVCITHVVETIKKIDPKFVEADWNTMLNKPFGTSKEYGTVLAETALEFSETLEGFLIKEEATFEAGQEYTVTYNGAPYVTRAVPQPETDDEGNLVAVGYALGNLSVMNPETQDDTGEPFLIMYSPYRLPQQGVDATGAVLALDGAGSVTLSIQGLREVVRKLDPQYVDTPDWNAGEGESGHIKNRTHYIEEEVVVLEKTDATTQIMLDRRLNFVVGREHRLEVNAAATGGPSGDAALTLYATGTPIQMTIDGLEAVWCEFAYENDIGLSTYRVATAAQGHEEEFRSVFGCLTIASEVGFTEGTTIAITKPKVVKKIDPEMVPPAPIPYFDLEAMGLEEIPTNGSTYSGVLDAPYECEKLLKAAKEGIVQIGFRSQTAGAHVKALVLAQFFDEDESGYAFATVPVVVKSGVSGYAEGTYIFFEFTGNDVSAEEQTY